MTIHTDHPFAAADGDRDQARRLRGALGGAVTLWTSRVGDRAAALTVSSLLVVLGEPHRVIALIDPDSDLSDVLLESMRATVSMLTWTDRHLAEVGAGLAPAPGGIFRQAAFIESEFGPRPVGAGTWAEVRLESERVLGWSREVVCVLGQTVVGGDEPLVHRRGRYQRPHDGPA